MNPVRCVLRGKEFVTETVPQCSGDLTAALRSEGAIVLDLSEVGRLDGAGVGAIAYVYKRARRQGRDFWIEGVSAELEPQLNSLGLGKRFRKPPVVRVSGRRGMGSGLSVQGPTGGNLFDAGLFGLRASLKSRA